MWEKNNDLHSIYHPETGTEAYAIFTANKILNKGHIIKADTPIMAMFKKHNENAMLTVANPDLKLKAFNHNMSRMPDEITHGASEGSVVNVSIKGEWFAAGSSDSVMSIHQDNGQTMIQVFCKDGLSVSISLQKRADLE